MGKSEKRCAEYWDKVRALAEVAEQASKELAEDGRENESYILFAVARLCERINDNTESAAEFWDFIEPRIFME